MRAMTLTHKYVAKVRGTMKEVSFKICSGAASGSNTGCDVKKEIIMDYAATFVVYQQHVTIEILLLLTIV